MRFVCTSAIRGSSFELLPVFSVCYSGAIRELPGCCLSLIRVLWSCCLNILRVLFQFSSGVVGVVFA